MNNYKEAAKLIKNSKKVLVLTGAGISTDSGILDFRSKDGYYSKMDPTMALSRDVLIANPERFYKEGYLILEDLNDKLPNEGHKVLAWMEKNGYISGVITQNIDNLHQKAGSINIYEVHGETRSVRCVKCMRKFPFKTMQRKVNSGEIPPRCDSCNGVLRPNVVMFGDIMPMDFENAIHEVRSCDTLIVVGSSLTVAPVSFLPNYAKNLIIINKEETPLDSDADFLFRDSSSQVLQQIKKELEDLDE